MQLSPKDVILGVLVAYVVTDVLLSLLLRKEFPSLMQKLGESLKTAEGIGAVVAGVLLGVAVAYVSAAATTL
jgi:fructose-specific phosphotransferase system IIC component